MNNRIVLILLMNLLIVLPLFAKEAVMARSSNETAISQTKLLPEQRIERRTIQSVETGEIAPIDRRLLSDKRTIWFDLAADYWLFQKFQNSYTNLKPYMQTGLIGPKVTVGIQRLQATGQVSKGVMWVKSPPGGMEDQGSGPVVRKELFFGVDLWRDLVFGAGWFRIDAEPMTEKGMTPLTGANGYYLGVNHKVALNSAKNHGLRYGFRYYYKLHHYKQLQMTGYNTLNLPEASGEGYGFANHFDYSYSCRAPIEFYAGIYSELYLFKKDYSLMLGPQLGLNFKL